MKPIQFVRIPGFLLLALTGLGVVGLTPEAREAPSSSSIERPKFVINRGASPEFAIVAEVVTREDNEVADVASAALVQIRQTVVKGCGPNAVMAGTVCLDSYEATVWRVPDPTTTNANLVRRILLRRATRADLTAGGAAPLGTARDDYAPCTNDGQNCADDIYAVSLPSEIPAARITWFQAQEACANAGGRLPTSAEWQVGANGTPDPGPDNGTTDCNTTTGSVSLTGARSSCVSARGAFDMVGNLYEWVADWVPLSASCLSWGGFSDDDMCLAGANETARGPGALLRGGNFNGGSFAGPLAVDGGAAPSVAAPSFGFRCVRESLRVLTRVQNGAERSIERERR